MKYTKYFVLTLMAFTALVLAVSSTSALQCLNLQTTAPTSVNSNQGTFSVPYTLTINSTDPSCNANRTGIQWQMFSNVPGLTWTTPSIATVNTGQTRTGVMTFSNLPANQTDDINIVINLDSDQDESKSFGLNAIHVNQVSDTSFCNNGEQGGNLEISDVKIDNNGEGKDDEWQLLDQVEIRVKVENNGDDDIDDVFVELGLFDSEGRNQINDLEFDNADEEEYDIGRIRDGDDDTATFTFTVPADFDDGSYRLKIKAYSDDLGENVECTATSSDLSDDTYQDISVERESDSDKFISFQNIQLTPQEATCGDAVTLNLDAYNIGDEDLQDQIRINLVNTELGINQYVEIRKDLDQGDRESATLEFTVPQNAKDKFYNLELTAEYDYRNGLYREESQDPTIVPLRVLGCTGGNSGGNGQNIAVINAVLASDSAVAGNEVEVRATITNLESTTQTFTVTASGYSSWANLDSGTQVVQLGTGESGEVTFTFLADDDSEGRQSFSIEVRDNDGNTQRRTVDVNVEGGSSGGSGIDFGNNTFLWIIGIVNVVLVVLIIVVIVRIARR